MININEKINNTIKNLTDRGFIGEFVSTKALALERIKELIPKSASIMNGSSRTLEQIGFIEYLKGGEHGWNNLHANILNEKDPELQAKLRRESVLSEFYLGSAHAITELGEILIASNTGSQLPHLVFTSPNIILIVGMQKVVPNLNEAFIRLNDYVYPLEDQRMKTAGMGGSFISKELIIRKEQEFMGRKFHIIFVEEILGF